MSPSPNKASGPRRKSTRGAGRPTRGEAAQRQSELLESALDMFLERGYERTTMDAVAASVSMAKRTVYARYADKAALFRAAVQHAIDAWTVSPESLQPLDTGDLETTLIAVARMRVAHSDTPSGLKLQRVLATESYRFPEIFTLAFEQGTRPVIDFLAALFERQQAAGVLRVASPRLAASAFLTLVVSGPVRLAVIGSRMEAHDIEERIAFGVTLFLDGLRARPPTAGAPQG